MASKKSKYYQRPDGLYEAIRIIDGKRKAFRGHSPKEVEQKMIAYQGEMERGRTFREIAEEWEEAHFHTLAPNTLKGYRPASRRVKEHFGDTPVRQIKAPDIKKFISEFAHAGPDQTGRAQKTVANQLLVISLIMGYAAESGEIEFNPCANVSIPRDLSKSRREAASPEDETTVKASADIWLFPYLVLYTGLRKGEALALTYGDIDYKAKLIHITKSIYHISNKPYIKKPKTVAGIRAVPILDPLLPRLPKSRQKEFFLFSGDGGASPLTEMQYQKNWMRYVEATNIQYTAHQLRHTAATNMHELTGDFFTVGEILGHSLKGLGNQLGVPGSLESVTTKYVDVRLKRKRVVLDTYHKAIKKSKKFKRQGPER